ncbi:MAG: glucose-1-phosphate thymidylyltransferase [Candidatus Riflebacteria bacterium]|nr:glucose-1-phosphate thymidylyltransferase [Candidatus Riflebacteria bacterium]
MLSLNEFFARLSDFCCPELFATELEGYDRLENVWDILKRIQKGFVASRVQPGIHGTVEEGAFIRGNDIYIGKGSIVEAGAMVCGPAIIGENVEIRHGAFVRGQVIIGNGAVVGHSSEVVRSVFLPGAKAPHFNYVGDSILGTHVNLGAGTKLSNLKNDGSNVRTKIGEHYIDTGIRKFGAILGDNCQMGCNSVANPGTILEPDCKVYPCTSIQGHFERGSIIKLRQNLETAVVSAI